MNKKRTNNARPTKRKSDVSEKGHNKMLIKHVLSFKKTFALAIRH